MWIIFSFICIISGAFVALPVFADRSASINESKETIQKLNPIVGIIALVFGILNFIHPDYDSALRSGDLSFIGDFIPALLLILTGISLSQDYILNYVNLSNDPSISDERKNKLTEILNKINVPLGILVMIFGFLHFFLYHKNLL